MTPRFYKFDSVIFEPHTIHYTEWGDKNNPPVVCVHGLTRNGRDFDYLAKELSKEHLVICPDIPGRGSSDWLENKLLYNYDTYIRDMILFLDSQKLSNVKWVGTSMGGLIGMMIKAIRPDLIGKMVLNDIGPHIPLTALERISRYVGMAPEFNSIEQAERHFRKAYAPFGIISDADWRYFTIHSVMNHKDNIMIPAYDPAIAYIFAQVNDDVDLWSLWENIHGDFLVIRGLDSEILLADTAKKMQATKENITLFEIENVGHAPALMDEIQIKTIAEWL